MEPNRRRIPRRAARVGILTATFAALMLAFSGVAQAGVTATTDGETCQDVTVPGNPSPPYYYTIIHVCTDGTAYVCVPDLTSIPPHGGYLVCLP